MKNVLDIKMRCSAVYFVVVAERWKASNSDGIGCYQFSEAHEMHCNGDEGENKRRREKWRRENQLIDTSTEHWMSSCYRACYKQYAYEISTSHFVRWTGWMKRVDFLVKCNRATVVRSNITRQKERAKKSEVDQNPFITLAMRYAECWIFHRSVILNESIELCKYVWMMLGWVESAWRRRKHADCNRRLKIWKLSCKLRAAA